MADTPKRTLASLNAAGPLTDADLFLVRQGSEEFKATSEHIKTYLNEGSPDALTFYAEDSGSSGTNYTVSLEAQLDSLTDGVKILMRAANDSDDYNVGKTLAVNSLAAAPIKSPEGYNLLNGEIRAGQYCLFVYRQGVFYFINTERRYFGDNTNNIVNVGTGEDFTKLVSALRYFSQYQNIGLSSDSDDITLNLITGYEQDHICHFSNYRMGHIVITSTDATVPVSASVNDDLFKFDECKAPKLATLFDMDLVTGDNAGIALFDNSTMQLKYIDKEVGIINCPGIALYMQNNANIYTNLGFDATNRIRFSASGDHVMTIVKNSSAELNFLEVDGSTTGGNCIDVQRSNLEITNAVLSNLTTNGENIVTIVQTSIAYMNNLTATNCNATAISSGDIVEIVGASSARLDGSTISGCTANRGTIYASEAAIVSAESCTLTGNTVAQCVGSDRASSVDLFNTDANSGSSDADIKVLNGGVIAAAGAQGTLSITANTLTSSGIIYQ